MKIRVTSQNYHQEVLQAGIPVLVEFFAAWCGKCAMMEDIVTELAEEYDGVIKVCQIEIDESESLTRKFEVEVVPTFVVFKNGNPVSAASGVLNKETLDDMIRRGAGW